MTFRLIDMGRGLPITRANIERVGEWDHETYISAEFIEQADDEVVKSGDGLITFYTRTDSATYGLGRLDVGTMTYPAKLLSIQDVTDANVD